MHIETLTPVKTTHTGMICVALHSTHNVNFYRDSMATCSQFLLASRRDRRDTYGRRVGSDRLVLLERLIWTRKRFLCCYFCWGTFVYIYVFRLLLLSRWRVFLILPGIFSFTLFLNFLMYSALINAHVLMNTLWRGHHGRQMKNIALTCLSPQLVTAFRAWQHNSAVKNVKKLTVRGAALDGLAALVCGVFLMTFSKYHEINMNKSFGLRVSFFVTFLWLFIALFSSLRVSLRLSGTV